jgi:serine/threonine protein kinase
VDLVALRAAFRQVAEGVEALHRAGKLHRDLKPSNVLVRPNGHVAILDFGLAADLREVPEEARSPGMPEHAPSDVKSSDSSRRYDSTDRTISGTALYMSPEQALAGPLTPASDWYAVGVMLFEALTGRLPIAGDALSVMVRKTIALGGASLGIRGRDPGRTSTTCASRCWTPTPTSARAPPPS